jgi:serine/threonine protein kinase
MAAHRPIEFGKYILLDRIAIGGMAEIFRAKATGVESFEKILAIKRIHPNMSDDKDFIKMFIDEAKIVGQLAHPNIAQIFELGRIEGHHFIAMEFIWGKDLLQLLTKFKRQRAFMNPYQAGFITSRICEALDYAHKKRNAVGEPINIVHRDVSPQNILVSYDGEVKIIDFGIAKARDRSSQTAAGVLKGKFGYMSPEQVRGLPIDHRSDIFAIGTLLYEMLTSKPLFVGNSDLDVLEKVRNVDIPPPRQVNPKIPPQLEKIILKALEKDVDDRYQWGSEMQEDLDKFINSIDPIYSAKRLGDWMQKVFNVEKSKEQNTLESMLVVAEEMLDPGVAMAQTQAVGDGDEKTVMLGDDEDLQGGVDIAAEKTMFLMEDDDEDDFEDNEEATRLLEDDEDIGFVLPADMVNAKTQFLDDDDDIAEAKTQFLDDDEDIAEAKTQFFDDDDDDDDFAPPLSRPGPGRPMPGGGPRPGPGPRPGGPPMGAPRGPSGQNTAISAIPDIGIPGLSQPMSGSPPPPPQQGVNESDILKIKKKAMQLTIAVGALAFIIGIIIGKLI